MLAATDVLCYVSCQSLYKPIVLFRIPLIKFSGPSISLGSEIMLYCVTLQVNIIIYNYIISKWHVHSSLQVCLYVFVCVCIHNYTLSYIANISTIATEVTVHH